VVKLIWLAIADIEDKRAQVYAARSHWAREAAVTSADEVSASAGYVTQPHLVGARRQYPVGNLGVRSVSTDRDGGAAVRDGLTAQVNAMAGVASAPAVSLG